jgi:NAD(P)-dependent dehydrogenase (short-subunit alcohol dehydrogenase family)
LKASFAEALVLDPSFSKAGEPMNVQSLSGRVGAVTGAASGIGRATALELASRGADVAICDVDAAGLKETADRIEAAGRRAYTQHVDVTQMELVQAFADSTYETFGRVDLLVNNAGVGVAGPMLDVPLEEFRRVIEINLMGVVHGCYAFLPRMREAARPGHVANIASMAGYWSAPSMSSYHASKFGVVGFSESIRAELARYQIGVTAICPGVINTPILRSVRMFGPEGSEENRQRGIDAFARRGYTPERVARNIMKAIQRNRALAPISPEAWFFYYLQRLAPWIPRGLGRLAARKI